MAKKELTVFFILLVVAFCCLFLVQSCGGDNFSVFKSKVEEFRKNGDTITVEEWEELKNEVNSQSTDREFSRFFTQGILDEQKLEQYLTKLGLVIAKEKSDDPNRKVANIYIENSGSMFGFVYGNTEFKNAMTRLIVELKANSYSEENIHFYFINKKVTPRRIEGNIEDYPMTLTGNNLGDADSGDSNINEIFKQILERTAPDTLSVLFSDCIYSVHKDIRNNDVDGALKIWNTKTVGVFNDVIKNKGFSTLFVQLTSAFNGTYYTKDNRKITLNGKQIPYYITVIGEEKDLEKFSFVHRIDGFQNKLVFTNQDYSKNSFYSLIQTNEDNGTYKPVRDKNADPNAVRSIQDIRLKGRTGDPFVFSVAVDFSKLPVDENYLLERNNYTLNKGDYEIVSLLPYDKHIVKPNALKKLERNKDKPTHIIVFESTSNKYDDLVFSLKKNVPKWIYEWNTNDDSGIKDNPNQTFGIRYLAEGIFEAYQNNSVNKEYITLTINIKK